MAMAMIVGSWVILAADVCAAEPVKPNGPMTSQDANRQGLAGAATAPLRDLNLIQTKIPPVLWEAMANPYIRPTPLKCSVILEAVSGLDDVLGADLDQPSKPNDGHLLEKGREAASDFALDSLAGAAQDLIPYRGWVRKLTGAERHDRLVRAAIIAGGVRRAYLKGLGDTRGCKPPAAPLHHPYVDPDPRPKPVRTEPGKPQFPVE